MKQVEEKVTSIWKAQRDVCGQFNPSGLVDIDYKVSYDILMVGDTVYDQVKDDAGTPVELKP